MYNLAIHFGGLDFFVGSYPSLYSMLAVCYGLVDILHKDLTFHMVPEDIYFRPFGVSDDILLDRLSNRIEEVHNNVH